MKKVLGKGLSALIPDNYISKRNDVPTEHPVKYPTSHLSQEMLEQKGFRVVPIENIVANKDQPRKDFSPEGIEDLASSIQEKGLLQPMVVTRMSDEKFMLICGERRFRAAKLCGLTEVPVVIKDIAMNEFLEWALIENIQREDLNPLEEAAAYQRLIEERNISQDDLAKRLGKSRSAIANTLRLLKLPEDIRSCVVSGQISEGHARALLGLLSPEHQRQLLKQILQKNLSVRQVENLVSQKSAKKRRPKKARHLSPEIVDLEGRIAHHFGTQVKIYPRKNQTQGRLEIHYYSLDDLEQILEKIHLPQEKV